MEAFRLRIRGFCYVCRNLKTKIEKKNDKSIWRILICKSCLSFSKGKAISKPRTSKIKITFPCCASLFSVRMKLPRLFSSQPEN